MSFFIRWFQTLSSELRYLVWRWFLLNSEESPEARLSRALGTSGMLVGGELARRASDHFLIVKGLVEKCPRWVRGHKILCEIALESGNALLVSSSIDSVVMIEGYQSLWARTCRAEGSLRKGDIEGAHAAFESLVRDGCSSARVLEGLGATSISKEEWNNARLALERIPSNKRTAPTRAALQFVRQKLSSIDGVTCEAH